MMLKLFASFLGLLGSLSLINAATLSERSASVRCPSGHTTGNKACCVLFPILQELQGGDLLNGECGDAAHSVLRLVFHDAIAFSPSLGGGGADGSIVTFNATELTFQANDGLDDALAIFASNILAHPEISPGDYLQFANAVGLTNCPGAPRVKFLLGRPQPKAAAPDGLVPEPFDSVTKILSRMGDAGFSPSEVIALLSSHSIAGADTVDPTIPGTPFDSTPATFDTQFFLEVLLKGTLFPGNGSNQGEVMSPIAGEMRLQSDHDLARDPRTACTWQSFVNNEQQMQQQFAAALEKLSVVNQNVHQLIDCSDVIPPAKPFHGAAVFPPTLSKKDVEVSCPRPFPVLSTLPGPATTIPPIPQGGGSS